MTQFINTLIPFLDQCLKDFGMAEASSEQQAEVLETVSQRLQDVIVRTAIVHMNAEQNARFAAILEKRPLDEDSLVLLGSEIPNFSQFIEEALVDEYQRLVAAMKR